MKIRTAAVLVLALAALVGAGPAAASEESTGHAHRHRNHLAAFGGGHRLAGQTSWAVGAEYERRVARYVGLTALGELTFADQRETTLAAGIVVHPFGGLELQVLAGRLSADEGHDDTLWRFGAGYGFEVGGASLGPSLSLDRVEGETAVVFGLTLGWGF